MLWEKQNIWPLKYLPEYKILPNPSEVMYEHHQELEKNLNKKKKQLNGKDRRFWWDFPPTFY